MIIIMLQEEDCGLHSGTVFRGKSAITYFRGKHRSVYDGGVKKKKASASNARSRESLFTRRVAQRSTLYEKTTNLILFIPEKHFSVVLECRG